MHARAQPTPDDRPDPRTLQRSCERIEQLLAEITSLASPPAAERVDTLVRLIVQLYGEGLTRMVEHLASEPGTGAVRRRWLADEVVSALLLLHDLHPQDLATRVAAALERVRPYLGSHGGDVALVRVDPATRTAYLRMTGSCDGCPSSAVTVKLAIEGAVKESAPEIAHLQIEGAAPTGDGRADATPPMSDDVSWITLLDSGDIRAGTSAGRIVNGAPIVVCRVDTELYAYDDRCMGCDAPLGGGPLDGAVLECRACGRRYDVRRAGRSVEDGHVHLAPVPLLQDASGVRVARAETRL